MPPILEAAEDIAGVADEAAVAITLAVLDMDMDMDIVSGVVEVIQRV